MTTSPTLGHVSVVMCTRNRADKIGQAVASVLANDHPNFALTIIDQSTDDATHQAILAVAGDDPRVRYVHTPEPGLSRAYNRGIAETTGDVLAFTDDDCIAPTDWVSNIARAFEEDPGADLLYGQVLPAHPEGDGTDLTPYLEIGAPERLSKKDGYRVFGMGANFAARRRLFDAVGPFDEMLGGGGPLKSSQDFDLAYRTYKDGHVIVHRPEVVIRHDGRRERADWPTLMRNYGFGDGAFYSKHVRCRDPYALYLLTRQLGLYTTRFVGKSILRRPAKDEGSYVHGVLLGIRAGFRYPVERHSKMYLAR